MSQYCFRSIAWERIDGILTSFAYALIFTASRLGFLHVIFQKLTTELWPLIDVRISFPLNILRTNQWNLRKFLHIQDTDKISVGIVTRQFFTNPYDIFIDIKHDQYTSIIPYNDLLHVIIKIHILNILTRLPTFSTLKHSLCICWRLVTLCCMLICLVT